MATQSERLGKYTLQRRLAQGGMGEVWEALDTQLQRLVAIKILRTDLQHDPDFITRFKREAQLVAALHHPNIVQIHDFHISYPPETEFTRAYMVMDYIQGETLADYIRRTSRKGKFPPAENLFYLFTTIGAALDYAHSKGMIHRDIKPANILLDQYTHLARPMGEPIISDFGIARLQGMSTSTMAGMLLGTPHYIAPEQAQGRDVDKRSDLYALGIILYEMTTGITPFRGDTTMAIIVQQITSMPTPPALINPAISPALSAVILKSIAKQPDDRFQSASELCLALAEALHMPSLDSLKRDTGHGMPSLSSPTSSAAITPARLVPITNPAPPVIDAPIVHQDPTNNARIGQITPWQGITNLSPTPQPALYTQSPTKGNSVAPQQKSASSVGTPPVGIAATPHAPSLWRGKRLIILLASLFLAVLLLSGTISFVLVSHHNIPSAAGSAVVGQVRFSHSPQAPANGYDQVQIDIQNVPALPQGQAYYAWLEAGGYETYRPHWPLTVSNGAIHATDLRYPGNASLLTSGQTLIITSENVNVPPTVPNPAVRLYYAVLIPSSNTTFDIKSCTPDTAACLA